MKIYLNKDANLENIKEILNKHNIYFELQLGDNTPIVVVDDLYLRDIKCYLNQSDISKVSPIYDLKYVLRLNKNDDTIIDIKGHKIGGGNTLLIAGPCAVEEKESMKSIALAVKKSGADVLRGGAFKPRTNPYSYQGLNEEGLKILSEAGEYANLPVISEITDLRYLDSFIKYVDIIQVGARNMQNFALLEELGNIDKPILLKRGFNNTIEELLCSAEYIMKNGNQQVILCERGIRTPLSYTRNTLDLSAVAVLKELTHLPIIVDPSHSTGKRKLVIPMAKAALTVGADGLIIEASINPNFASSDAEQTIDIEDLKQLRKL